MAKYDLNSLSAKEKLKLFLGKNNWQSEDFDGKLYSYRVSDGPLGLRMPENPLIWGGDIIKSVAYPCLANLASTWNEDLSHKMGAAIGSDCVDHGIDILLGPGINIKRTPINGRNFEYLSEDPLIAGLLGKAYIEGVQSNHVGVSLKHYCCNNREFARRYVDCRIDKRTLMEIYLRPFKTAIEAKPWTIMNSYNKVNGTLMSENKELLDLAYSKFGFDGAIISDWESVHEPIKSFKAPITLEMPYNESHYKELVKAYEDGILTEEEINEKAKNMLALVEKCESEKKLAKPIFDVNERLDVAQEIAEESFVLLKNDGVLPLKPTDKVLVTGNPCFEYYAGGGSSRVNPNEPFEGLDAALTNAGIGVTSFWNTVFLPRGNERSTGDFATALELAKKCDYVIFGVGNHESNEGEERDRYDLKLTKEDLVFINCMAKNNIKTILVVYSGGVVELEEIKDKVSAIVYAGFGGQRVSQALANVLTGRTCPSGRLAESWVKKLELVPEQKIPFDGISFYYDESIHVGYRCYNKNDVLFPFGYGLSYSQFSYSNFDVRVKEDHVIASFEIKNNGKVKAKDVPQLYYKDPSKTVDMPEAELCGFAKVELNPGESKKVEIAMPLERFAHFNCVKDDYVVSKGRFEIKLCRNCLEVVSKKKITL